MKLSLAEAFVEMGDRDGALALLDEIMPSATPEQAAKAEEIRNQIEGGKS
jgi:pilus assembly protein FimV